MRLIAATSRRKSSSKLARVRSRLRYTSSPVTAKTPTNRYQVSLFPRLIIVGAECYMFYPKVPNLPFAQFPSACNCSRFYRESLVWTLLFICLQKECRVNPTRLLGVLALAAGGSLLLSEPLLGQDLLIELTGTQLLTLRFVCTVAIVLGLLAVRLGIREEKEFYQNKEGMEI